MLLQLTPGPGGASFWVVPLVAAGRGRGGPRDLRGWGVGVLTLFQYIHRRLPREGLSFLRSLHPPMGELGGRCVQ